MLTEDYRVQLDAFEGPMDLLLFLIRRDEIDIHDIPVARIATQYMSFLEHIDRVDIDAAGEFLVTAATLLEIKSRMLAPRPEGQQRQSQSDGGPTEDPRAELVRQLLAYKAYRDAATALEQRAEDWRLRVPAAAVKPTAGDDLRVACAQAGTSDTSNTTAQASEQSLQESIESLVDADLHIEDLTLVDLIEAFRRVSETVNFDRLGTHSVTYDDTPIELHAEDILDRIVRDGVGDAKEIEFTTIFRSRTRSEMVGLFLALLDLCRRRRVAFRHDETGLIRVRARTAVELAEDAAAVGTPCDVVDTLADHERESKHASERAS